LASEKGEDLECEDEKYFGHVTKSLLICGIEWKGGHHHMSKTTMSVQFHWLLMGNVFSLLPFK